MSYSLRDKIAEQISHHWWKQDPAGGGSCACGQPDLITDGYTYHLADVILATTERDRVERGYNANPIVQRLEDYHGKATR